MTRQIEITEETIEDLSPIDPKLRIMGQWLWLLKWWAGLVTILTIAIPVFVFMVGFGVITLPDSMFITYVSAATGGNTILAIAGTKVLGPLAGLGQ